MEILKKYYRSGHGEIYMVLFGMMLGPAYDFSLKGVFLGVITGFIVGGLEFMWKDSQKEKKVHALISSKVQESKENEIRFNVLLLDLENIYKIDKRDVSRTLRRETLPSYGIDDYCGDNLKYLVTEYKIYIKGNRFITYDCSSDFIFRLDEEGHISTMTEDQGIRWIKENLIANSEKWINR